MEEEIDLGIPNFFTGLIAFVVMVGGPDGPVWRFPIYLLALPPFVWLTLRWVWRSWRPIPTAEERVRRVIAGGIAVAAVVGAVFALTAKDHYVCTQEVRTADGTECVGDNVTVPGADRGGAFMCGLVAFLAGRFAMKSDKA